jgi:hypothetical protein
MIRQPTRTRFYVHGDLHEVASGKYYCASCDLFVPMQHFEDADHISCRARKYEQLPNVWKEYAKRGFTKYYRPTNPDNSIAELAAADIRAEKSSRSKFFR